MATKPVKQGWVLKKNSKLFSQWHPRYMILYPAVSHAAGLEPPTIQIYNQCDQSQPPSCQIPLNSAQIQIIEEQPRKLSRFPFVKKRLPEFVLTDGASKVTLFFLKSSWEC
jgi:hypothetical protein